MIAALVAVPAARATTPAAVRATAHQVVPLTAGADKRGAAVQVGPPGFYVTANVLVARTDEIKLLVDGRLRPASHVGSDAPSGLALLQLSAPAKRVAATPVAAAAATKGDRVWLLSEPSHSGAPVIRATTVRSVSGDQLSLARAEASGHNGGPVLNARGQVIAVTVPPAPGASSAHTTAVAVRAAPKTVADATSSGGWSFPAVPVAVFVGLALLATELVLRHRRRRGMLPEGYTPAAATPPPAEPEPVASGPAEDELEITLLPRR